MSELVLEPGVIASKLELEPSESSVLLKPSFLSSDSPQKDDFDMDVVDFH